MNHDFLLGFFTHSYTGKLMVNQISSPIKNLSFENLSNAGPLETSTGGKWIDGATPVDIALNMAWRLVK
jgi:hypothetical protein